MEIVCFFCGERGKCPASPHRPQTVSGPEPGNPAIPRLKFHCCFPRRVKRKGSLCLDKPLRCIYDRVSKVGRG